MKDIALYPYSKEESISRNEILLWEESCALKVACRSYMMDSFREKYNGKSVPKDIIPIAIEKYGKECVKQVLASTIQEKDYDGRISDKNKMWANSVIVPDSKTQRRLYVFHENPGVTDIFANQYHRLQNQLQEKETSKGGSQ